MGRGREFAVVVVSLGWVESGGGDAVCIGGGEVVMYKGAAEPVIVAAVAVV